MLAPMIKAIQDQKKTIESLKSENELLKERLEKLESIVSTLSQGQK
jgi:archaellum component FlaC